MITAIFPMVVIWYAEVLCCSPDRFFSIVQLFDARDVNTPAEMFEAICKHIKYGTNKGNIR